MTTLAELESQFTTNKMGIITNCGKFEGETLATPFYYDIMLDGGGEVIEIDSSDRLAFDISDKENFVVVHESNDGFVTLTYHENRIDADLHTESAYNYIQDVLRSNGDISDDDFS